MPSASGLLLASARRLRRDAREVSPAAPPARHFVHAATVGLNVNFAKLATRASLRDHLGRFTYLAAATSALRARPVFECELRYGGRAEKLSLTQLSVINAPVFGGALGLSVQGSNPDDRLLDVLAPEDLPARRLLLAAVFLLCRPCRARGEMRFLTASEAGRSSAHFRSARLGGRGVRSR